MDKASLMQAWLTHGRRLQQAAEEALMQSLPGRPTAALEAAAELNRFLDHSRDLMKLDAEADGHLSARDAQGGWQVMGNDRVALQKHRERLGNEHQWFMEYKQESGISPMYPAQVAHGAQISALSEDGRSVLTHWDTQSLAGLIRQSWEDLKTEAPQVLQSIRQAWDARDPSDQSLHELCVSLNRTAAGVLGGVTAPTTWSGLSGPVSSVGGDEAADMASQGRVEQTYRLSIPRGAPSLADWQRQVGDHSPEEVGPPGLQLHEAEAVVPVDVPASWLASHALADELAERSSIGQLKPQEAQAILQQVADPETRMAEVWPALLVQAERGRAETLRLPENDAIEMSGSAWVAGSPVLSPMQKSNFRELLNHFEAPLAQLTPQDRRLAEQVMAFHYVDEVAVHGGMEEPVAVKLAALAKSETAAAGHPGPYSGLAGAAPQPNSQSPLPSGLDAYQQALNQAMAPVWKENDTNGHWTADQVQQLQAFALRTAVHHHLGPRFTGAWLSHDGQRIGVMDSIGVLRDFAVADALKQSPQQSWTEAVRNWEASAQEAAVARTGPKERGTSDASQSTTADGGSTRPAEAVPPSGVN